MENYKFTYQNTSSPVFKFGQGKSILLVLHGWGSSIKSWQNLLEKIDPKKFTTYFLELPGFGDASLPSTAWGVDEYLDFIKQFLTHYKIKPKYLLIHSFGGRIAIKWLNEKDCPIKKAIFLGAAGVKPKLNIFQKFTKKFSPSFKFFTRHKLFRPIRKLIYKLLGGLDYLNAPPVMQKTLIKALEEDLTPLLVTIKIPVHLIWGKHDTYTPLWMGKTMKEMIPSATIITLENAKHGIHLTHPEVVLEQIDSFFK